MTRLLWLIDSLHVGGAESLVIPFASHIAHRDVALTVCAMRSAGDDLVLRDLARRGIPTLNLEARNLRDRTAFRRLVSFATEQKIDLVHAHLTYSAIWSALLTRRTGIPSVASLHVAPSATRAQERGAVARAKVRAKDRLMRFVLNRWSRGVIMVSGALRDTYLAEGGLDPEKVYVVHNGIEVQRFDRNRQEARAHLIDTFGLAPDAKIAVTVSVLRPQKGIEVLLAAAKLNPDVSFLIIGDGPKRDEWTSLAARSGISDRVRWAGHRTDVDALLAGCDVFIHPSLDDAFPTVLLEAMAAGLPVVASRVGGIPEIVEDGTTGLLVPAGDPNALASAVRHVLHDDGLRASMRAAAHERAAREFSVDAWIDRLDIVYRKVLAS